MVTEVGKSVAGIDWEFGINKCKNYCFKIYLKAIGIFIYYFFLSHLYISFNQYPF